MKGLTIIYSLAFAIPCYSQTLSGGGAHVLALCPDSTLRAWGLNANGQLGHSSTVNKFTAIHVHGLKKVTALGSGVDHSIVLKDDGTVWAWGSNNDAQLGDSTVTKSVVPLQVHGPGNVGFLTNIISIARGHLHHHNLVLRNDSTVLAWGANTNGQLGDSTLISKRTPVKVYGLSGITALATADLHSLALKKDSTVWGWGYNGHGQLGDSSIVKRIIPVKTYGLTGITAISGGELFSLALKSDGTVWGWGYNWNGQLGNGTNTNTIVPTQATGLTGVIAIATGTDHSLALKSDSTVWAWGYNYSGQLGDSTNIDKWTPVKVKKLTGVVEISGGGANSYAKKKDGTIWVWGMGTFGQLGNGTTGNPTCNCSIAPVQVWGPCGLVTGIPGDKQESEILIYPNPSNGRFRVQTSEVPALTEIEVLDIVGREISKHSLNSAQATLNLELPNGIYFLQIKAEQGMINRKFIIQH